MSNKIDVLPFKLYEFICDEKIVDRILKELGEFNYHHDNSKNESVSRNDYKHNIPHFFDEELFDWFDTCLEEVRKYYFKDKTELVITDCWVNKTNFLQSHHKHSHPNSIVSGVFYLQDMDSSPINFSMEDPWVKHTEYIKFYKQTIPEIETQVNLEKGKLILFPSHLVHRVLPNKEKMARYSIAFNTFLKGDFGDLQSATFLTLNPVSIRDRIKNEIDNSK